MPRRLLQQITAYIAVERAHAVTKGTTRAAWSAIERPIFIRHPTAGAMSVSLRDGGTVQIDALTPDERGRLVVCDDDGIPLASAILWLTEVGLPVQPNTWEVAFARACRRCANAGFPMQVSPHQLRHYIPIPTMSGSNITAQDSKALCDSL